MLDLGLKKKKKKKVAKDGDDEFAAKLAALDIDKEEGAEETEAVQEGDMYVHHSTTLLSPYDALCTSRLASYQGRDDTASRSLATEQHIDKSRLQEAWYRHLEPRRPDPHNIQPVAGAFSLDSRLPRIIF